MSSAADSSSPAEGLRDFSDSLSPMLVRELRQGLRAKLFVLPFLVLQLAAAGAVALEYLVLRGGETVRTGEWWRDFSGGPGLFWLAVYTVTGFVMPLRGLDAMREEADSTSGELLMIAGVSRWSVARGKWFVQWLLCLLSLVSLMPHMIVRYFFGGVELLESLLSLLSVAGVSAAFSGVVIGASGHRGVVTRFALIAWCGLVLAGVCIVTEGIIALIAFGGAGLSRAMWLWISIAYISTYIIALHALYAVAGMQLARAHLKPYLLPNEADPVKTVTRLLVFYPFLLIAGAFATCGYGAVFVVIILVGMIVYYDPSWKPAASLAARREGRPGGVSD